MSRLEEDGLLAVLCDGMGGMTEGGRIAGETVSKMLSLFPWKDDLAVPELIRQWSSLVYKQFRGMAAPHWSPPCSEAGASLLLRR